MRQNQRGVRLSLVSACAFILMGCAGCCCAGPIEDLLQSLGIELSDLTGQQIEDIAPASDTSSTIEPASVTGPEEVVDAPAQTDTAGEPDAPSADTGSTEQTEGTAEDVEDGAEVDEPAAASTSSAPRRSSRSTQPTKPSTEVTPTTSEDLDELNAMLNELDDPDADGNEEDAIDSLLEEDLEPSPDRRSKRSRRRNKDK